MASEAKYVPADATCVLCGKTFAKRSMTRHLRSCRDKHPSAAEVAPERMLHLLIEGKWQPDYYLHVEVPAKLTYGELDGFLRTIWLECCGHLSGFRFKEPRGALPGVDFSDPAAFGAWLNQASRQMFDDSSVDEGRLFREKLGKRLAVGIEFEHDYDYGTTTTCTLRVIGDGQAARRGDGVFLLARNNPPDVPCAECGKPAAWICTECAWDGVGGLCEACAADHPCGDELRLPLVNSPRAGDCAYNGPATWDNQPVVPKTPPKGRSGVVKLSRKPRRG